MLWLIEVEINYNLGLVLFLLLPPPLLQTAAVHQSWGRRVPASSAAGRPCKCIALHCALLHHNNNNALHCITLHIWKRPDTAPVVGEAKLACSRQTAQSSRLEVNSSSLYRILWDLISDISLDIHIPQISIFIHLPLVLWYIWWELPCTDLAPRGFLALITRPECQRHKVQRAKHWKNWLPRLLVSHNLWKILSRAFRFKCWAQPSHEKFLHN